MKRIFCLPVRTGSIVMVAMLTLLAPIASSRVYAQERYTTNPYGQGPYGEYSQGYAVSSQSRATCSLAKTGIFGSRDYRYSGSPTGTSRPAMATGSTTESALMSASMADRAITSHPTAPFTRLSGTGLLSAQVNQFLAPRRSDALTETVQLGSLSKAIAGNAEGDALPRFL